MDLLGQKMCHSVTNASLGGVFIVPWWDLGAAKNVTCVFQTIFDVRSLGEKSHLSLNLDRGLPGKQQEKSWLLKGFETKAKSYCFLEGYDSPLRVRKKPANDEKGAFQSSSSFFKAS